MPAEERTTGKKGVAVRPSYLVRLSFSARVSLGLGCHGAYISSGRPMEGEKNKKIKKETEVGVEARASPPRDVCAGERLDR